MLDRAGVAIGVVLVMAGAIRAQRPVVGAGATSGIFLGSQLAEHTFTAAVDGERLQLLQRVRLYQVPLTSIHAEWYVTPHIALRAHGAWGAGDLEVATLLQAAGDAPAAAFGSEEGTVHMRAVDAGVSVWPWAPRSTGFTPFVTVGIGTVRYGFDSEAGYTGFFQPAGDRSRQALLLGIGADMEVARWLMLRMEAINHRVESPLDGADFEVSDRDIIIAGEGDRLSNVRLVLGAHVYLPFGKPRSLE